MRSERTHSLRSEIIVAALGARSAGLASGPTAREVASSVTLWRCTMYDVDMEMYDVLVEMHDVLVERGY